MDIDSAPRRYSNLVLKLKQYPLLSREIRERMRTEIFHRGVITRQNFEREVRQRAHDSQLREGFPEAAEAEPAELWSRGFPSSGTTSPISTSPTTAPRSSWKPWSRRRSPSARAGSRWSSR
jgi:hypothetical protein